MPSMPSLPNQCHHCQINAINAINATSMPSMPILPANQCQLNISPSPSASQNMTWYRITLNWCLNSVLLVSQTKKIKITSNSGVTEFRSAIFLSNTKIWCYFDFYWCIHPSRNQNLVLCQFCSDSHGVQSCL